MGMQRRVLRAKKRRYLRRHAAFRYFADLMRKLQIVPNYMYWQQDQVRICETYHEHH